MKLFKLIFGLLLLAFTFNNTDASGACDTRSGYKVGGGIVNYYTSCSYCVTNYVKSVRIPGADAKTFESVRNPRKNIYMGEDINACNIQYGKDKNHVYYRGQRIIGLSSESFVLDDNFNIKDHIVFPRYLVFLSYLYHYKLLILIYFIPLLLVLYIQRRKKIKNYI